MISVTIVNIIAVLLTYLSRYPKCRYGFVGATILLICFYGIRYDYGNDYMGYFRDFMSYNLYDVVEYSTDSKDIERGWLLLNRLFAPLGFPTLVFFLTIIQFGTIYWLIKKYVGNRYCYLVLFFYLFSPGLMLTMLSMMRQALAMNIVLWAVPFILKKRFWLSLLLIYLAAQFHQSAYMMLLLPFTVFLMNLSRKLYVGLMFGLFVVLFFSGNFLSAQINFWVENYFDKYEYYTNQGESEELNSGLGFILNLIFFSTFLFGDKHERLTESWFVKVLAISYVFIPLGFIIPIIGRIGTYFQIAGIIGLVSIKKECCKRIFTFGVWGIYVFMTLYAYITFFYSDVWIDKYMEYNTILDLL